MRRLTLLTNPDTCNLHCPLCFLNQRGGPSGFGEMPIEVARRSIEKYAGVREVIPSTMGEPLLYSHFEELLELCMSRGTPLNLTTNGSFPKKWGSDEGLKSLLLACSDIKVSTLSYETGGLPEDEWNANVEKLWLTHFSPSLNEPEEFLPAAQALFPDAVGPVRTNSLFLCSLMVTVCA